jgi:hypothetical protein
VFGAVLKEDAQAHLVAPLYFLKGLKELRPVRLHECEHLLPVFQRVPVTERHYGSHLVERRDHPREGRRAGHGRRDPGVGRHGARCREAALGHQENRGTLDARRQDASHRASHITQNAVH